MDDERPTNRQWLGLLLISFGVLLSPVAAFWTERSEAMSIGVAVILVLALGASQLPRGHRVEPTWLRVLWIAAIAVMAGLLGYAMGVADAS